MDISQKSHCMVKDCSEVEHLIGFPKDSALQDVWAHNMGLGLNWKANAPKRMRICINHFENRFRNPGYQQSHKKLLWNFKPYPSLKMPIEDIKKSIPENPLPQSRIIGKNVFLMLLSF